MQISNTQASRLYQKYFFRQILSLKQRDLDGDPDTYLPGIFDSAAKAFYGEGQHCPLPFALQTFMDAVETSIYGDTPLCRPVIPGQGTFT